jgi:hypothetical protein
VNVLGWLMMTVSVGSVIALTSFCLYRVFKLPKEEVADLDVAPLRIDTRDTQDPD